MVVTQPTPISGRPLTPPPGVPVHESLIARFRSHARRLALSGLILIATVSATAYFAGNLPEGFEDWMLFSAAALIILFLVIVPWLAWVSRRYTITNRRVIVSHGLLSRTRSEVSHARGYSIQVRRGPLQRIWGAGTLTLSNGVEEPLRLINVPSVNLVHETLVDQVELNQILAHRGTPIAE